MEWCEFGVSTPPSRMMYFHRSDAHQPAGGLRQYRRVEDLFTRGWSGGIGAEAELSRAEPSRAEGDEMNIYSQ